MDYCVQVWNPHLNKDILILEKVHKIATKMIYKVKDLDYNARKQKLNLTTLETRRLRADMLETFKIIKGIERVNRLLCSIFSK